MDLLNDIGLVFALLLIEFLLIESPIFVLLKFAAIFLELFQPVHVVYHHRIQLLCSILTFRIHHILNIIIGAMSKTINSCPQLKKAIFSYLKGLPEKDANIHKIEQLAQSSTIDRMAAVQIYGVISNDSNHKLQNIIRLLDKRLISCKEYATKPSTETQSFSLSLHVNRLKTLVAYSLPYEETVQILLQHILINEPTQPQFLILLTLLQCRPFSFSRNYIRLIANLFDLLQEYLSKEKTSPSFIGSTAKFLSNTPFKIPNKLNDILNQNIDRCLPYYSFMEILTLSHHMREKSLLQWNKMGNLQTSPIRKRIIYQYILNKQYGGLQYKSGLPGKNWANADQLQQALKSIRSFGVKESYIDIFQTIGQEYSKPLEGYQTLQKPQFSSYYIDYIFGFIKNGCRRIDLFSYYKIMRTIKSFFTDSAKGEPGLAYLQQYASSRSINLMKLATVLYELGRYQVAEYQQLQIIKQKYLNLVYQLMSKSTQGISPFSNTEISLVYNYLSCEVADYLSCALSGSISTQRQQRFKVIKAFLGRQKQKKFIANQYSKLLALYKYVEAVCETNPIKLGGSSDILLHEQASQEELKQLLEGGQLGQADEKCSQFLNRFKLIKNVEFQPNITVKYALIQQQTKTIQCVFDYYQLLNDKLSYELEENNQEQSLTVQRRDLNLSGLWRKKFFNSYYKCKYNYCRDELQLTHKLHRLVKSTIPS